MATSNQSKEKLVKQVKALEEQNKVLKKLLKSLNKEEKVPRDSNFINNSK